MDGNYSPDIHLLARMYTFDMTFPVPLLLRVPYPCRLISCALPFPQELLDMSVDSALDPWGWTWRERLQERWPAAAALLLLRLAQVWM